VKRLLTSCCIAALALTAGCAVGPDFVEPKAPEVAGYLSDGSGRKAGQQAKYGADISGRWWSLFGSPHLSRLIEDGIANNPDLKAAEAGVRMAQANALAVRGGLFPTVAASFDASRQQNPSASLQTNAASGADLYSLHTAQLTVSYVLDVWGGTRRALESAQASAEQQVFLREAVYLTLTANIALAAIQEASLRGQIEATRRVIAIQLQQLDLLRKQSEAGQVAEGDVLAQETAVAQARLLLPPLEKQLAQQRHLLATLTGRFPADNIAASFRLSTFKLPRKVPLSLPADFVRQRPDIRAAEANVHALNAQIGVAIANRLPQITLSGNTGSTADAMDRLFSTGTNFWTIAGNVTQPIFNGGTLRARQIQAEAAWVQAAEQYRSTVLQAFQNVADALRALQADDKLVQAARAAEQSASRSLDLVRSQVAQGQASLPVLLNAQNAYLQTSLARVQAEAQRLADTVALFQALGGGWWNREEALLVVEPKVTKTPF
jgi:NodT family efflux transporter outer membrane factor (OMF) lipoprotein